MFIYTPEELYCLRELGALSGSFNPFSPQAVPLKRVDKHLGERTPHQIPHAGTLSPHVCHALLKHICTICGKLPHQGVILPLIVLTQSRAFACSVFIHTHKQRSHIPSIYPAFTHKGTQSIHTHSIHTHSVHIVFKHSFYTQTYRVFMFTLSVHIDDIHTQHSHAVFTNTTYTRCSDTKHS